MAIVDCDDALAAVQPRRRRAARRPASTRTATAPSSAGIDGDGDGFGDPTTVLLPRTSTATAQPEAATDADDCDDADDAARRASRALWSRPATRSTRTATARSCDFADGDPPHGWPHGSRTWATADVFLRAGAGLACDAHPGRPPAGDCDDARRQRVPGRDRGRGGRRGQRLRRRRGACAPTSTATAPVSRHRGRAGVRRSATCGRRGPDGRADAGGLRRRRPRPGSTPAREEGAGDGVDQRLRPCQELCLVDADGDGVSGQAWTTPLSPRSQLLTARACCPRAGSPDCDDSRPRRVPGPPPRSPPTRRPGLRRGDRRRRRRRRRRRLARVGRLRRLRRDRVPGGPGGGRGPGRPGLRRRRPLPRGHRPRRLRQRRARPGGPHLRERRRGGRGRGLRRRGTAA
jgi:hypothetical protein